MDRPPTYIRAQLGRFQEAARNAYEADPSDEHAAELLRINAAVSAYDAWRDETEIRTCNACDWRGPVNETCVLGALRHLRGYGYTEAEEAAAWKAWRAALAEAAPALTDEQVDKIANAHFTAMNGLTAYQWRTFARAVLAAKAAPAGEQFTPELVEERLHAWRQRLMNKSGDRLALDDFMSKESIDDLIDFVCDAALAGAAGEPGND